MSCPCRSGESYENCCAKFIVTAVLAFPIYPPTAEALMRSRFTAFAIGDASYLRHTWHPDTAPGTLDLDPDQQWYLLEILSTSKGGYFDQEGVVSFRAHYRSAANRKLKDSLTETSAFSRVGKQWLYVKALER